MGADANANASPKGFLPAFINDKLRSLCNDYEERHPADPKEGVGRQLARLALTLAVLVLFLFIALGLFHRQPAVYNMRILKARFYKDGQDYFEFTSASAGEPQVKGLRKLAGDKVTAFDCPCRKQSVTWSKFTQFYALEFTVEASGSSTHNTTFFHDTVDLCRFFSNLYGATTQNDTSSGQLRKPKPKEVQAFNTSCYNRLRYIIGPDPDAEPTTDSCVAYFTGASNSGSPGATESACSGLAVQFESNRLMDSEALNLTVSRRLLDSISRQPSSYYARDADEAVRQVRLKATLQTYREMVFRVYIAIMVHLQTAGRTEEADKQSPQENYYDNSKLFNGTIVSLGMQVNWTKYYEACDPPWCDVNKVNRKRTMTYTVLVQLGGLLSIATFGVQSLLWPALSTLCFTSAPRPAHLSGSAPADPSRSTHLSFTFVPRILAWRRRASGWRTVSEDVEMQANGTT